MSTRYGEGYKGPPLVIVGNQDHSSLLSLLCFMCQETICNHELGWVATSLFIDYVSRTLINVESFNSLCQILQIATQFNSLCQILQILYLFHKNRIQSLFSYNIINFPLLFVAFLSRKCGHMNILLSLV